MVAKDLEALDEGSSCFASQDGTGQTIFESENHSLFENKRMSFHAYVQKQQKSSDVTEKLPKSRMKMIKCRGHRPYPDGICNMCRPLPITLKQQEFSHVDQVLFENEAILNNFYAPATDSGIQRLGYMIGRYEVCPNVPLGIRAVVCSIYIPPQNGSHDDVELLHDKNHQKILKLCEWLGLEQIGWIYTCCSDQPDMNLPCPKKCMTAATFQLKHKNYVSEKSKTEYGSKFVSVTVSKPCTGNIQLFCYQMSNQFSDLVDAQLVQVSDESKIAVRDKPLTRTQYITEILQKKDSGPVKVNGFSIPVNDFLVDIPTEINQTPASTFAKDHYIDFAREAHNLYEVFDTSDPDNFMDNFSNFQFIKELATNSIVSFPENELKELCEAIKEKNEKNVGQWIEHSKSWNALLQHFRWIHQLYSGEPEIGNPVEFTIEEMECSIRIFFESVFENEASTADNLSIQSLETYLQFEQSMSDKKIVERLWAKIILENWIDKTVASFKKWLEQKRDLASIQLRIKGLLTGDFWNISKLEAQVLHETLMKHKTAFNQEELEMSAKLYTKECMTLFMEQNKSFEIELRFLEMFVQEVLNGEEILLNCPHLKINRGEADSRFRPILNYVIGCCPVESPLVALAELLLVENFFFMSNYFLDITKKFIEPTRMSVEHVNGIAIGKIVGSVYFISDILPWLWENEVQEIHLISNLRLVLDQDVCLPGKNIYIRTEHLLIPVNCVIDVSGADSSHRYSDDAGVDSTGKGHDGKDGFAGESAGNVLIEAARIDRCNLTVLANGGAGSNGQTGGHGTNGKHGQGITLAELQKMFPPASPYMKVLRNGKVATTINNIDKSLKTITRAWTSALSGRDAQLTWSNIRNMQLNYSSGNILIGNRQYLIKNEFSPTIYNYPSNIQIYVVVLLKSGLRVTYAFECGDLFTTNCQCYCLVEGSNGGLGGDGGPGGHGGQGGFGGSITINQEIEHGSPGKDGKNAEGGKHGEHGKNGWDVGWLDYSFSGMFADTWPKLKGEGHNSKLELKYYSETNSNRVVCPLRKAEGYSDFMVELVPTPLVQLNNRETTVNTTRKTNRDHHATATRKSNISTVTSSQDQTATDMLNGLVATIRGSVLEISTCAQMSQDQVKANMKVNRQMEYLRDDKNYKSTNNANLLANKDKKKSETTTKQLFFSRLFHLLGATEISIDLLDKLSPKKDCYTKLTDDRFLQIQKHSQSNIFLDFVDFFSGDASTRLLPNLSKNDYFASNEKFQTKYGRKEKAEWTELVDEKVDEFRRYVGKLWPQRKHEESKEIEKEGKRWLRVVREFAINTFEIKEGSTMNTILDKYRKWMQFEKNGMVVFDETWEKLDRQCMNYQSFNKQFKEHLKQKPSFGSFCHLEMYAQMNNLKIVLFELSGDLPLLKKQFNKTGKQVLRIVFDKDGVPHQLKHNMKLFYLEREREQKNRLYSAVLDELLRFSTVKELQTYFRLNRLQQIECDNIYFQGFDEDFDVNEAIEEISSVVLDTHCSTNRLLFITEPFIGTNRILLALRERIRTEGCLISSVDLAFFINSIHDMYQVSPFFEELFLWIILSTEQNQWLTESAFLSMENHLQELLPTEVKKKLKLLNDREVILLLSNALSKMESASLELLQNVVGSLHEDTSSSTLNGLRLPEWPYILKAGFWKNKLLKVVQWSESDLEKMLHYFASLEPVISDVSLKRLLAIFEDKKTQLTSDTCLKLVRKFYSEQFFLNEALLSQLKTTTPDDWLSCLELETTEVRSINKLVEIMNINSSPDKTLKPQVLKVLEIVQKTKELAESFENCGADAIRNWSICFKRDTSSLAEMLTVIDRAIELTKGFRLRDTQKLAVALFLVGGVNSKVLEQVSTGEGKSLIVASVAIIKSLIEDGEERNTVDIITSSSVLAKRDAESNKKLYDMFNLEVGHNCSESVQERTNSYGKNQIVYGEIGNFQRDYLLDRFYGKNIFGDRKFDTVIVDEVDSMLLDKGNNVLYLSHPIPGFDKLEKVLVYIWQLVNQPVKDRDDFERSIATDRIRENVIDNLYKKITKNDLTLLSTPDVKLDVEHLWNELVEKSMIDARGRLLFKKANKDLVSKLTSVEKSLKGRTLFLFNEVLRKQCMAAIPNFLIPFVEDHLTRWIDNAKLAFVMRAGNDYVVDVDRTGTRNDLHANITILDRDTGTDQGSSQWEEGLHQFLQLKHGCKVSLMSLKAIFISNVSYFKLYKNLNGLTGTLGSQVEMDLLREMHKVDYYKIPTSRGKQFEEETPIAVKSYQEWLERIEQETRNYTTVLQRSVLIICETVECVNLVQRMLEERKHLNVFAYRREHEHFTVADAPLEPCKIIVATNLAGRGTDIKISPVLKKAGGLHVILTYLPTNKRVEEQAFGRAARSGDPGSGRLVILSDMEEGKTAFQIIHAKAERDKDEITRVCDVKRHYDTQIRAEENCFEVFDQAYKSIKTQLDFKFAPNILENLIDQWAFWLDKWKDIIKEDGNTNDYGNKLIAFIQGYGSYPVPENRLLLHHALRQGQMYIAEEKYETAIEWFDKVIKRDPDFSEGAHYYQAYALGNLINWKSRCNETPRIESFKQELQTAKRFFEKRSNEALYCAGIVNKMKENFESTGIIQINSYEEQKKCLVNMYRQFISSIDDALGATVTADSFNSGVIDDKMSAEVFNKLLKNNLLENLSFSSMVDKDKVNELCQNYGISSTEMKELIEWQKGKTSDPISLARILESSIKLPSRDDFWKELLDKKVIVNNRFYVLVDLDMFYEEFPLVSKDKDILEKMREEKFKEKLSSSPAIISKTIEQVLSAADTSSLFDKEAFAIILKDVSWERLIKSQLVTEVEVADWNEGVETVRFESFDELKPTAFDGECIPAEEASLILDELVNQELLSKDGDHNRLKGNVDQVRNLHLKEPFNLYTPAVQAVLLGSFSYRIAYKRLQSHRDEKLWPMKIQLMHKPHQELLWDMVDAGIITPVRVKNSVQLGEELEKLYPTSVSYDDLLTGIAEAVPNLNAEVAIRSLISRDHLVKSYFGKSYTIADKPVEIFSPKLNQQIHRYLNSQMMLSKASTKAHLLSILEQLKGYLLSLDVPRTYLQDLCEAVGPQGHSMIEELNIFMMNGLCDIIRFKEKPWTYKMLTNTIILVVIALLQVTAGALIELYSMGLMTNLGVGLINEGVGDLIFAASALRSGYFSWSSYLQHKLVSAMCTTTTWGIGAFCSRGAQVSRYGQALAHMSTAVNKIPVVDTCGNELIAAAKLGPVLWKMTKDISVNAVRGVAFGLASTEVSRQIDSNLQTLCHGMAEQFLIKLDETTSEHNISTTIEKVYAILGSHKGIELIQTMTNAALANANFHESLTAKFTQYGQQISRGIMQGLQKQKSAGLTSSQKMFYFAYYLGKGAIIKNLMDFVTMVGRFLDDLDRSLLHNPKMNTNSSSAFKDSEELNRFKLSAMGTVQGALKTRAGEIVAKEFVEPILQKGATLSVIFVGSMIKKQYRSYRNGRHTSKFNEYKASFIQETKRAEESGANKETIEEIEHKYQQKLNKFKESVRDPKLYAAIIREGGFMDANCMRACAVLIHEQLMAEGSTKNYKIVICAENGLTETVQYGSSQNCEELIVDLKNNHFTIKDSEGNTISTANNGYDCMIEALAERIPEVKSMQDGLRNRIADLIETNEEIGDSIRRGHHALTLRLGLSGGKEQQKKYELKKFFDIDLCDDSESDNGPAIISSAATSTLNRIEQIVNALGNKNIQRYILKNEVDKKKIDDELIKLADVTTSATSKHQQIMEDFKVTGYNRKINQSGFLVYVPVQWEKDMYITSASGEKLLVKLELSLDNPGKNESGPTKPHVGYKIVVPQLKGWKLTGHTIFNKIDNMPTRSRTNHFINAESVNNLIEVGRIDKRTVGPSTWMILNPNTSGRRNSQ